MNPKGFANCQDNAIELSKSIPGSGVAYGIYFPDTPKDTWHPFWNNFEATGFTHFWVEKDDKIIDPSASQFGGPEIVETTIDNKNYVKVGIQDKGKVIPVIQDPKIVWNTLTGVGGSVRVIWNNPDDYYKKRLGWI